MKFFFTSFLILFITINIAFTQATRYENGFKIMGPIVPVLVGPLKPIPDRTMNPYQIQYELNDIKETDEPDSIPKNYIHYPDGALQENYATNRTPTFNELFNVAGFSPSGYYPPDPISACGDLHFVVAINGGTGCNYRVYDKITGAQIGPTVGFESSFDLPGGSIGDPVIVYDDIADRWVLCEMNDQGDFNNVYVSLTNDILTTSWYGYQVPLNGYDYPKMSMWPSAYFLTLNDNGPYVYALDRAQMLLGNPTIVIARAASDLSGFGLQALAPVDYDGNNPPPVNAPGIMLRHRDTEGHGPAGLPSTDYLEVFEFGPNFASPASSTWTSSPTQIPVAEFSSELGGWSGFDCFPQPGTAQLLMPMREVILQRPQYINFGGYQSIVCAQVTDVNGNDRGGIRWYEIRKPAASWTLYQQGTYAPNTDDLNRWFPAISQDINGNIAICYSVGNATTTYPGLRMTARSLGDPLGQMTLNEYSIIAGSSSQTTTNRWGDYFSMTQDPVDWEGFYFDGQYMTTGGNWRVRNFAFKFSTNSLDLSMLTVEDLTVANCNTTSKTIDAIIRNAGITTITSLNLSYSFNGGSTVVIPYTGSIGPGLYDTIQIVLTPLLNGNNTLLIYTSNPNGSTDEDFGNDTLSLNIPASFGLSGTATQVQNILCWNQNNGQISINATGGFAPYTYSIGGSYGASSTFNSIGPGTLTCRVKDAAGCIYDILPSLTFTNPPNIVATANIVNATSGASTDGSITVNATGGTGSLQYNLNGGAFQSSNLFSGLGYGNYTIVIEDTNGCTSTIVVSVGALGVDVNPLVNALRVYPNPTFGKVNLHYISTFIAPDAVLEIYNQLGQTIKTINCGDLISGQNIEVDISGNARGVYTFRLTTGKWSAEVKVMLQ